jgi:hypothetical protein
MSIRRYAIAAAVVAGFTSLSSAANAQYYSPLCNPFPLTWPFCVVGAIAYGAGAIVTAPFRALAPYPPPPYYPPPYYGPPAGYAPPPYSGPPAGYGPGSPVPPPR